MTPCYNTLESQKGCVSLSQWDKLIAEILECKPTLRFDDLKKALEKMGVKVVFESPKLSEIESADTLFISSTSMAAMPVSTLNSKPIKCDFDFVKRVTTYVRAHELD